MTGKLKKKQKADPPSRGDDLSLPEIFPGQEFEDPAALAEDRAVLQSELDEIGFNLSVYKRIEKIEKAKSLLRAAGYSTAARPVENVNFDYVEDLDGFISDLEDLIKYGTPPKEYYELRRGVDERWKLPPANDLDRDGQPENDVPWREPVPLEEPDAKEPLALENIDHQTLAAYVAQLEETNPAFATALKAARTARHAFGEAAQPSMPLPTVAPKLWADNTEGLPATAFVAKHYKPWIEAGLMTLKAIKACDPELGKAYSNRIHRHPDEAVALVRATRSDRIEDPQEAIERVRKASRDASARRRAEQADKPANTPG